MNFVSPVLQKNAQNFNRSLTNEKWNKLTHPTRTNQVLDFSLKKPKKLRKKAMVTSNCENHKVALSCQESECTSAKTVKGLSL